MVVLVTGASGQLGQALQSIASDYKSVTFIFADSSLADITNKENLINVFSEVKPDFCINAAAYTAVDKAETEPEKAFEINVTGSKNLAEVCRDFDTTLIYISTDFVFDGNKITPYQETDSTNPTGIYAESKRQGEIAVAEILTAHFIIRTSWVYSQFGNNFMKTMLRLASERDTISVVNDQVGTPTYAIDLAKAIMTVVMSSSKAYGIYHFSNEGETTWHDFAKKIFEINQISIELQSIPTTAFPTPAKRPAYSVLDKTKIKETFGISIPNWEDSLKSVKR